MIIMIKNGDYYDGDDDDDVDDDDDSDDIEGAAWGGSHSVWKRGEQTTEVEPLSYLSNILSFEISTNILSF